MKNAHLVNNLTRIAALFVFAALLCSCASTSIKHTWKSPDCKGPVGQIAVLAIEERALLRQGIENRFVEQLTKGGASAAPTHDLLSLPQIKQDKRAAGARLSERGAKALIIVRLIDKSVSYREITLTGQTESWYDYYSLGSAGLSSTHASLKEYVYLETAVYDLQTEKRVWSAVTQTVITENMDRVAELDPLIAMILAAMKKDGVIP